MAFTSFKLHCLLASAFIISMPSQASALNTTEKLKLNSHNLKQLSIEAGAGELTITGHNNTDQIQVSAAVYSENGHQPLLSLVQQGDQQAKLVAKFEDSFWQLGSNEQYIHLNITLPSNIELDIHDGSGDIKLQQLHGKINIKDGSGNIDGNQLGQVSIHDGSGDITLHHAGNINITDGSGDIMLTKVAKVSLDDGSGKINLSESQQSISINDGSGAIMIKDHQGGIDINDGSGDINISHTTGNIDINDGSGDININQVMGIASINDGSGDINIKNTKGVNIQADGSGETNIDNIDGAVTIN
ncbi:DUF4097 family beta strand repeat-containing protein [Shewanella marina]|uniref:DUF4097 family beta strand repeat-containing protein n=1 Tax=Shewanella marina TaxID=487319 RepID=UPI0004723EA4|nr:DUF4097 family beta strand repeat-containing protein [Shewanella marina]